MVKVGKVVSLANFEKLKALKIKKSRDVDKLYKDIKGLNRKKITIVTWRV